MISKQYFEETFSLATAQALQTWADENLITQGVGDYGMKVAYNTNPSMFAETTVTGLTIGNEYILKTDTVEEHVNRYRTKINSLPNDNSSMVAELGFGTGIRTLTFTATAETMYIAIGDENSGVGIYFIVDNVSLKVDGVEAVSNGTFEAGNTNGWSIQTTGAAILTAYEYNVEPPVSTNPYLEAVNIPLYDSGNATHFLIDTPAKYTAANLNNASYQHFYIVPGDYTAQGRPVITTSGSASSRRTLSLYDGLETHPASLTDNEQANIAAQFFANYWTFSRVSAFNRQYSGTMNGGTFLFDRDSTHNILDRIHTKGGWYSVRLKKGANYNTIQKCFFDEPNSNMFDEDYAQIMFQDWVGGGTPTHYNKVILNECRNFKFIKLHDEADTNNDPSYNGTVIDSNINWSDGDVYCDSDGTPNQNGLYSIAESGCIGVKSGSTSSSERVIISNNIYWGGKPTYPDAPSSLSSPAPGFSTAYYGSKYLSYTGNMAIGTPNCISLIDRYDQPYGTEYAIVTENISYQTGNTAQSVTEQSAGFRMSQAFSDTVYDNLLKQVRGTAAFIYYNYSDNSFTDNYFVDCPGDGSWGMIRYEGNNSDVDGLVPTDENNYLTEVQGDAIYTDDYTFTYAKYTTSPLQTTIPNVIKAGQTRPLNEA